MVIRHYVIWIDSDDRQGRAAADFIKFLTWQRAKLLAGGAWLLREADERQVGSNDARETICIEQG